MHDLSAQALRVSADVVQTGFDTPLVSLRNVGCVIKGEHLLRGISVEFRKGRRTAVIGPNGAGKSLLLRLIHGMIPPSEGEVLWRGDVLTAKGQLAQSMVFQRPVMLRRSVLANLRFALRVRGFVGRERARRAGDALEMAGLTHLAKRPARVLSGGEQQRLAIARALACDPQLLLLDEPTASLDPAATAQIEALLMRAHDLGVTLVMVTHDQGQARRLAQDVVFLQEGQLAEAGPAETVLHSPTSEAARAWLDGRLFVTHSSRSL